MGHPLPWGSVPGRWDPIMSGFENEQGLNLKELEGYMKWRLCSHIASARTTHSKTQHIAFWVIHEIYWLVLGHVPMGQESVGTFFRNGSAGSHHISCPLSALLAQCCRSQFWHCLATLLVLPACSGTPCCRHPSKVIPTPPHPVHPQPWLVPFQ